MSKLTCGKPQPTSTPAWRKIWPHVAWVEGGLLKMGSQSKKTQFFFSSWDKRKVPCGFLPHGECSFTEEMTLRIENHTIKQPRVEAGRWTQWDPRFGRTESHETDVYKFCPEGSKEGEKERRSQIKNKQTKWSGDRWGESSEKFRDPSSVRICPLPLAASAHHSCHPSSLDLMSFPRHPLANLWEDTGFLY